MFIASKRKIPPNKKRRHPGPIFLRQKPGIRLKLSHPWGTFSEDSPQDLKKWRRKFSMDVLGGGNSNISVHPEPWGDDPKTGRYFLDGSKRTIK